MARKILVTALEEILFQLAESGILQHLFLNWRLTHGCDDSFPAEQLATEFAGQATTVYELNGLLQLMMKSALERMLNTELDVHQGRKKLTTSTTVEALPDVPPLDASLAAAPAGDTGKRSPNRRNGHSRKTVQGDLGEFTLTTPRDRDGTFEPLLIGKHQRRVPGFDEKILALYAKGMTTRDIQDVVQQLYGVEVSATLVSEVTNDLDAEVTAWRTRPLDSVWPIVYFDGIVVHVRGRIISAAMSCPRVCAQFPAPGRTCPCICWVPATFVRCWLLKWGFLSHSRPTSRRIICRQPSRFTAATFSRLHPWTSLM